MSRQAALWVLLLAGCGGRPGGEGDTCGRTADCAEPLRCRARVCAEAGQPARAARGPAAQLEAPPPAAEPPPAAQTEALPGESVAPPPQ